MTSAKIQRRDADFLGGFQSKGHNLGVRRDSRHHSTEGKPSLSLRETPKCIRRCGEGANGERELKTKEREWSK